ncbi:MAG TPA: Uma2 family endonuclease [Bacteroidetes bacterium]|nr:Uma2 family endonuclease [Bacteroidota bacterium]
MEIKKSSLASQKSKRNYTYRDYLDLPDDRNRYEILEGELIMGPAPITIHQRISRKIEIQLAYFVEKHNLGEIFDAPFDVIFGETNVIQPDLLFISNENKKILTEKNIQGAPDLIIEILSPATAYYDLIEKKEIYEKFGVQEYWIVDPKRQWIEIYTLTDRKYQLFQRQEIKGKIHSKILAGFELSLENIFK